MRTFLSVLLSVLLSLLLTLILAAAQIVSALLHLLCSLLPYIFKLLALAAVIWLAVWLFDRCATERRRPPADGSGSVQVRLPEAGARAGQLCLLSRQAVFLTADCRAAASTLE